MWEKIEHRGNAVKTILELGRKEDEEKMPGNKHKPGISTI